MGEYIAENVEGVDVFNYLWRMLYWLDNDWTEVLRNIRKEQQVWDHIGKLLRR